jgi:hypothetical protein
MWEGGNEADHSVSVRWTGRKGMSDDNDGILGPECRAAGEWPADRVLNSTAALKGLHEDVIIVAVDHRRRGFSQFFTQILSFPFHPMIARDRGGEDQERWIMEDGRWKMCDRTYSR